MLVGRQRHSGRRERLFAVLDEYRERVKETHQLPLFIPRRFMGREEWNRMSGEDIYRTQGVFPELQPDLAKVLEYQRVIIVGEPGAGKTTLAHAAMLEFLHRGFIPFFAELSAYRGQLALLLGSDDHYAQNRELIRQVASPPAIAFVLDGLDEVPPEHADALLEELVQLVENEPQASRFLTCRQAYYELVRLGSPHRGTSSIPSALVRTTSALWLPIMVWTVKTSLTNLLGRTWKLRHRTLSSSTS